MIIHYFLKKLKCLYNKTKHFNLSLSTANDQHTQNRRYKEEIHAQQEIVYLHHCVTNIHRSKFIQQVRLLNKLALSTNNIASESSASPHLTNNKVTPAQINQMNKDKKIEQIFESLQANPDIQALQSLGFSLNKTDIKLKS